MKKNSAVVFALLAGMIFLSLPYFAQLMPRVQAPFNPVVQFAEFQNAQTGSSPTLFDFPSATSASDTILIITVDPNTQISSLGAAGSLTTIDGGSGTGGITHAYSMTGIAGTQMLDVSHSTSTGYAIFMYEVQGYNSATIQDYANFAYGSTTFSYTTAYSGFLISTIYKSSTPTITSVESGYLYTGETTASGQTFFNYYNTGATSSQAAISTDTTSPTMVAEELIVSASSPITTTTITAWNVPDGNGLISGTEFLLALLIPTGLMLGISLKTKNPDSFVLIMLLGLMIGSIVGVIANLLPFALVFLFGAFLAIYIWRGRSSKGAGGGGLPEVT